jgi:hypothetical protein
MKLTGANIFPGSEPADFNEAYEEGGAKKKKRSQSNAQNLIRHIFKHSRR